MAEPLASDIVLAILFQILQYRLVDQKEVSSWNTLSMWVGGVQFISCSLVFSFFILELDNQKSVTRDVGLLLHTQPGLCLPCAEQDLSEHWNPLLSWAWLFTASLLPKCLTSHSNWLQNNSQAYFLGETVQFYWYLTIEVILKSFYKINYVKYISQRLGL